MGVRIKLEVDGKYERLVDSFDRIKHDIVEEATLRYEDDAKTTWPYVTGNLRRQVSSVVHRYTGIVRAGAPYTRRVDQTSKKNKGFIRRTNRRVRKLVPRIVEGVWRRYTRKP